jgi:hypothetical protein
VSALALALLLQVGGEPPESTPVPVIRYPLPMSEPELLAPGEPFRLVDLRYGFSDTFTTTHGFAARVRVRDLLYMGAELEGERRAVAVTTQRLVLAAEATEAAYDLFGSYRSRRFIVSTRAHRRSPGDGRGWRLTPGVALRLSSDFELLGEATTDSSQPDGPLLRATSAGFFWQRGRGLEAEGRYEHARDETLARSENVRDTAGLGLVAQAGPVELSGRGLLENVDGRFPRREAGGALGVRVPLAKHLLMEGAAETRFGRGVGERLHVYGGALTWFAKRFYLPRMGPAAERTVTLVRRARERGFNERRAFDDAARRQQRERLSLSPGRADMQDDMLLLYLAQVEERAVPTLCFGFEATKDALSGFRTETASAKVGVPWPRAWPWARDEDAVPFLRLDLERERRRSGSAYEAIRYGASLVVSLNRDMDLVVGWSRTDPTPLDLIRGIGRRRTVEVNYTYARAR